MSKYMNRKIELHEITAWRFDIFKSVEVKVAGEWYGYSSGPMMADELLELLQANIPREPDETEAGPDEDADEEPSDWIETTCPNCGSTNAFESEEEFEGPDRLCDDCNHEMVITSRSSDPDSPDPDLMVE